MIAGVPPDAFLQVFEPVLDRLASDSQRCFGIPNVRLTPVGHEDRPYSFLLRVAVWLPDAVSPTTHAFLKIFKPKSPASGVDLHQRVLKDFETTRAIHDFLSQWDDVGAVRPIACYEDLLAIVTEEARGETLLERLQTRATWFPGSTGIEDLEETMTSCGRWLKRFHGFGTSEGQVVVDDLLTYIDVRLRRLVEQDVITASYRNRIIQHLNRIAVHIQAPDLREVAVHADLAPANMLVCDGRIVVLDFAMAGRGSYLHDISRLFLQIDVLRAKPQFRPGVVTALQSALLRGLDSSLTPEHPLFRYLSMLHRINHLGTLALRRERFPSSLLSASVRRLHRRWIDDELTKSESPA